MASTRRPGHWLRIPAGARGIRKLKQILVASLTPWCCSLLRSVTDEVAKIPNVVTTAAVQVLRRLRTDKRRSVDGGPSTALNFLVGLAYAHRHKGTPKKHTTIASIICDPNSNYGSTFLNDTWIGEHIEGGVSKMKCWEKAIEKAIATGRDFLELGKKC